MGLTELRGMAVNEDGLMPVWSLVHAMAVGGLRAFCCLSWGSEMDFTQMMFS